MNTEEKILSMLGNLMAIVGGIVVKVDKLEQEVQEIKIGELDERKRMEKCQRTPRL